MKEYNVTGMRATEKGFSLVELVVVMAVVAILGTSVAVVSISNNLSKGRDSRRQTDLELVRSALEQYRYDNGKYVNPAVGGPATTLAPLVSNYLGELPTPPSSGEIYYYLSPTLTPGYYRLCARLENPPAPTPSACGGGVSCGTGTCNYQVVSP